jgi:hypothetical protein
MGLQANSWCAAIAQLHLLCLNGLKQSAEVAFAKPLRPRSTLN